MTEKIVENQRIPMNIQFFADTETEPAPDSAESEDKLEGDKSGEVTVEELMAQIASLQADNAKLKSSNDKLCASEGNLKKQLRQRMSAEETQAAQKAEQEAQHEEYVKGLEKKVAVMESTAQFMSMGFDAETAAATAAADYDGDKETVNANIKKMIEAQRKKAEADARAELLKNMPEPQSGNQGGIDFAKQINDALAAGDIQAYSAAVMAQARENGFGAEKD